MAIVRSRNIFNPQSEASFKLSRSKLELFLSCPRCFYIDRRLGIGQPSGPPFNLNKAVDTLLKKEFDIHRSAGTQHPLLEQYGVDVRPVAHEDLEIWRENFQGVQHHHQPTNLIITGAIDDLWINSRDEYVIVDYKATSKEEVIDKLNDGWHNQYRRQMEIYQWLLRQNGYMVSPTGYFVYCNAGTGDRTAFDGKLEFDVRLIAYEGNDEWVEGIIYQAKDCLMSERIPEAAKSCEFCVYAEARGKIEASSLLRIKKHR